MRSVLGQARAYILVLLIIGSCLGLAILLTPILPGQSLLFFVAGVMLCSVINGLTTGLFAAVIAAICHSYFFQYPRYSLAIERIQDVFELVVFVLLACTLNWYSVSIINSRKKALQALDCEVATSRFKDRILAVVAHDLRNPLTSIQICAQLIGARETNSVAKVHAQQQILRSVEQMNMLISDLLDADRIKTHHLGVTLNEQAVSTLMNEAIQLLTPLAEKKSIPLKLDIPEGLVVQCDRNRVLQVFSNVVGNAIKFSPKFATILISATALDGKVQFSITDSGPGIAPEDLPHIFEMFWQRPENQNMGIGLGLSIAKSIIELHGEHIEVFSQPGQGTRFVFTLPAARAAAQTSLRAAS